jgi:hypothetical protein
MMPPTLGRLERVDLRDIWTSEAAEFTPWLARQENLSVLGETLGIVLELEAQERAVGPFRADILCKDVETDRWVLVENQLERTDHTHLGQLLTGTKMRALYQRKAGRDLFDLATALTSGNADPERVVKSFLHYMEHEQHQITRALFEENLAEKLKAPTFLADISPLLSDGYKWDPQAEAPIVSSQLLEHLPGEPWKGTAAD